MRRRITRSSTETRTRPEISCADLDHLDSTRCLWTLGDSDFVTGSGDEEHEPRRELIDNALRTVLTEKQRTVVEMFFFDGMSQGEIARTLGVSQQVIQKRLYGAVRSGRTIGGAIPRLRRALDPLRESLGFREPTPPFAPRPNR
jgi:RNA polymerase sigma factor (sigma-70 family)